MKIIYLNLLKVKSTNALLKTVIESLDSTHLTVLSADYQYSGNGTFGKTWLSSENDLTLSLAFFIKNCSPDLTLFVRLGAEAVNDALKIENIKNLRIKWPNDIMTDQGKLAGILCETVPRGTDLCVIVGIGLNINSRRNFLDRIPQPAISLCELTGRKYDIKEIKKRIAGAFLEKIKKVYDALS